MLECLTLFLSLLNSAIVHTHARTQDISSCSLLRPPARRFVLCLHLADGTTTSALPQNHPPPCVVVVRCPAALGQHLAQAVEDVGRGRVLHIAHSGGALITYLAAQHHLTRRYAFASGWSPLLSALTTTSPTLGLKQPRPRSANILDLSGAVSLNPDEPCLIPVHWTVDNGARVFTSFLLYSKQPARWHCPNIFLLCLFLPVLNCPPETLQAEGQDRRAHVRWR